MIKKAFKKYDLPGGQLSKAARNNLPSVLRTASVGISFPG
jgi:hypothetical protein